MKGNEWDRESILNFLKDDGNQPDLALIQQLERSEECRSYFDAQIAPEEEWKIVGNLLRPDKHDHATQAVYSAGSYSGQQARHSASIQDVVDALSPTDDPHRLGRLGNYEVTGVIGAGGMGVVLKAFEPSLDRVVAIKVLAPHLAHNEQARRRFEREARAAAAVINPHVIPIYSVASDGKLPYLAMAYIQGGSLQRRLDMQGAASVPEVLRIGSQIASGLAAAHEQGLVHRDIKPENILFEGDVERVSITDFGLARAVDDNSLTKAGTIAGTPMYMSPEQASGEQVDQQSDLFSLGSVLYALCTGKPPYRAESSLGVMRKIADEVPTSIRLLNSDIPEWLTSIIEKLMARDKSARFSSATEVHTLLEQCLRHVQSPETVALPNRLRSDVQDSSRSFTAVAFIATVCALFAATVLALNGTGIPSMTVITDVFAVRDDDPTPGSSSPTHTKKSKKLDALGIRIAQDTTYFSELRFIEDYPDFGSALNEQLSKGIEPQENMIVGLMKSGLFPGDTDIVMADTLWGKEQIDAYVVALNTPIHISVETELWQFHNASLPFSPETQRPALAAFQMKLRAARNAANYPKFFSPIVTWQGEGAPLRPLGSSALPNYRQLRAIASLLRLNAKLQLFDGKMDTAWGDLWASMRMARLYSSEPLIEHRVFAAEVELEAINDLSAMLETHTWTSQTLRQQIRKMDEISQLHSNAKHVSPLTRCIAIDDILQIACNELSTHWHRGKPLHTSLADSKLPVDWNAALQRANDWYDRLEGALNQKARLKLDDGSNKHAQAAQGLDKEASLSALVVDLSKIRKPFRLPERGEFSALPQWRYGPNAEDVAGGVLFFEERLRQISAQPKDSQAHSAGQAIGDCIAAIRLPQILRATSKINATRQRSNNLLIALGLKAFFADHDHFPEHVAQLAPDYLASVPNDLLTGEPITYRRTRDGCEIISSESTAEAERDHTSTGIRMTIKNTRRE